MGKEGQLVRQCAAVWSLAEPVWGERVPGRAGRGPGAAFQANCPGYFLAQTNSPLPDPGMA